jgi:predicted phosphohydrolase
MNNPVSVRYWTDHCVHSRPFASLDEALEFLREGWRRREFAPDMILAADGRVVASREEVLKLLEMPPAACERALRDFAARLSTRHGSERRA